MPVYIVMKYHNLLFHRIRLRYVGRIDRLPDCSTWPRPVPSAQETRFPISSAHVAYGWAGDWVAFWGCTSTFNSRGM